jgi:outer membrane autotransporter protein
VTPKLGFDVLGVHTDAFTETGGLALMAPANDALRTRAWIGAEVGKTFALSGGRTLDLTGSLRVASVLSGREHSRPVRFGGVLMHDDGLTEGQYSAQLGLGAKLALSDQLAFTLNAKAAFSDAGQSAYSATGGIEGHF